jgi:hypothetical protein
VVKPQTQSGHSGEQKNLLLLPEFDPESPRLLIGKPAEGKRVLVSSTHR